MVPENTPQENIAIIREVTGFNQKVSPITYPGCPLYIGGQRIIYYSDLAAKITRKISGWQYRLLSFGGKSTMVKHVLQSIPIHTMPAISPPKTTIRYMKQAIADFFWGWDKEKRKYHWASWDKMSLPYDEGGIGVRKLEDICISLQIKQWWIFRSKQTLWGQFLRAKYCQRAHLVAKKLDTGQCLIWNFMMRNKGIADTQIKWKSNSGNSFFWWDDWFGEGPLASYCPHVTSLNTTKISQFLVGGTWNETMVRQWVPPLLVPKILSFPIHYQEQIPDEAIWKLTVDGLFSCSSAWEITRQKGTKSIINKGIWHRHLPFKISFLAWRALRNKLPTN
ncbi:hypothetical protein MTR67_026208 [Solanum verrucosum]|uniref:Reverse transcriptase zinc-binding domain-containing protein n=1 Tax=Solanum verrucosum TaxID=315347 RepID=A0AAF0R2B9_SOLVR|nr:hypothetical protein MTR67_026208 [Solanum verrucosum]